MELVPIQKNLEDNEEFLQHPQCRIMLKMSVSFYKKNKYDPPWIGYYAKKDGQFVGSCGFKGAPVLGKVEIGYGTFPDFQGKGIGTEMCYKMIELAQQTDKNVVITARTLMEKNYSTRILEKNGFKWIGVVNDPEDGDVWEWEYSAQTQKTG